MLFVAVQQSGLKRLPKNWSRNPTFPKIQSTSSPEKSVSVSKCSCWPRWSREETTSQGQTVVKDRLSPQQAPTILSDKQSIQEVTHESPPHNSHVATLKLRGPPIFPWKVYKHYISKKLKRTMSKDSLCISLFTSSHFPENRFKIPNGYFDRASWWRFRTLLVEALQVVFSFWDS